jgi:hypothetical protein
MSRSQALELSQPNKLAQEDMMFARVLTGRTFAALAGVAMLGATAPSASAFTLSAPSLDQTSATPHIERVYYYYHGYRHYYRPYYYHHYYRHPYYYHQYYHPYYHYY